MIESKLISHGSYGCIYHPGITCKGTTEKNSNFATKLQTNSLSSLNEINIGKMIMKIPNYNYYFVPVVKNCKVKLKSIKNYQEVVSKCISKIDKDNDNDNDNDIQDDKEYILMTMPYISKIAFNDIINPNRNISKNNIMLNLIEIYLTLLDSIKLLVENKIVHFDFKEDNILYNNETGIPQLIDFGISIPIAELTNTNLKRYFYTYSPHYYIWPLEVHVINYLINKSTTLTVDSIKNIVNDYVNNNKIINRVLNKKESIEKYKQDCINYLSTFVEEKEEKDTMTIVTTLIKTYKTWDNYSLSILYLTIFHSIFPNGLNNKNNLIINEFIQLLIHNTMPGRYSVEETIKKTNAIFYSEKTNVDTYRIMIDTMFDTMFDTVQ